ncbi:MAG: hypothetical protein MZV70_07640 [Desulfobacterales bacterium]|nr:hypothetical protein [Desulfobacterales bacterium]
MIALVCAVWATMAVVTVRGQQRLARTGGSLRPLEGRGLSARGGPSSAGGWRLGRCLRRRCCWSLVIQLPG